VKKPSPKKEVKKEVKKGKTGFELWKSENEADIKSDHPKLTPGKFLAKCLELWKELDEKDRQEWAEEEAKNGGEEEEEEEGRGRGRGRGRGGGRGRGEGEEEEGEEVEEEEGDY
jgi:hypothetical protein